MTVDSGTLPALDRYIRGLSYARRSYARSYAEWMMYHRESGEDEPTPSDYGLNHPMALVARNRVDAAIRRTR